MIPTEHWDSLEIKLIAILRGIRPDEAFDITRALLDAGFRAIEITMNSPDPYQSVKQALKASIGYGPSLIGGGTVLSAQQVRDLHQTGANLIVSPDICTEVVSQAAELGMACFPGVFTASEAHKAIRSGVTGLKFFPASMLGPSGLQAIMATLPTTRICAVGGIGADDFSAYRSVGVHGFGIGSSLYKPGKNLAAIAQDAARIARQYSQTALN